MQNRTRIAAIISAAALAGGATNAFASGFEKSVPFSGEVGGIAGAGAAINSGAESLFFQPAALAGAGTVGKLALDLNFSPSLLKSTGDFNVAPNAANTDSVAVDSGSMFSPFFGGFVSYGLSEKMGIGLGAYVAGGSNIEITGIEAIEGSFFDDGKISSQLTILETSLGLGYEIVDGLQFGAAYRLALVSGEFSSLSAAESGGNAVGLVQTNFTDLSDTQSGFRAGLRYAPKDAGWGLGAMYRSKIDFTVDGTVSGKLQGAAAPVFGPSCVATTCTIEDGDASLSSSFPEQFNVGGFFDVMPDLRTVLEFSFTRYAVNNQIEATGTADFENGAGGGSIDLADSPIPLGWHNQLAGKIGFIYTGVADWALRLGYSHVSQVVANDTARPTFTAPGPANYFSLGAGTNFGSLGVNAAYEYTALSGEGTNGAQAQGELTQNAHALHVGLSMEI